MGGLLFYLIFYMYKNIIFKDQCDVSKKVIKGYELYVVVFV